MMRLCRPRRIRVRHCARAALVAPGMAFGSLPRLDGGIVGRFPPVSLIRENAVGKVDETIRDGIVRGRFDAFVGFVVTERTVPL